MSTLMTRRGAAQALAGAALLPQNSPAAVRRKVGIIGGGMAGVSLAWLLDGERDVLLLEARDSLGGNVQTINVELDGHTFAVDVGAQFFHPGPYPTYVKLLSLLGLYPPDPSSSQSRSFPASITLDAAGELLPRFVSPVLPERFWPLLAPWNRAGLEAFGVGFAAAKAREEADADWLLTLEEWLPTLGLSQAQWEGMLLPWAASLYSGSISETRGLSARAAMIFAAKALPDNPLDPILYFVLTRGMIEALRRMAAQFSTVQVLTGARVTSVERRLLGGFRIHTADGRVLDVDDLVFASSGPPTLGQLDGLPGGGLHAAVLRGIEFVDARLALHTDPIYAPTDPNLRSFLNCRAEGAHCEASMWMAKVVAAPEATAAKVWKSWITHRAQQPQQVLHESRFQHMLPTAATIRAQARLQALQGQNGIWIAGGYSFPFDSQETALLSALRIAEGLQASTARMRMLNG